MNMYEMSESVLKEIIKDSGLEFEVAVKLLNLFAHADNDPDDFCDIATVWGIANALKWMATDYISSPKEYGAVNWQLIKDRTANHLDGMAVAVIRK